VSSRPVKTPADQRSSGRLTPRRVPAAARIRARERSAAGRDARRRLPVSSRSSSLDLRSWSSSLPGRITLDLRDARERGEAALSYRARARCVGGRPGASRRPLALRVLASERRCATRRSPRGASDGVRAKYPRPCRGPPDGGHAASARRDRASCQGRSLRVRASHPGRRRPQGRRLDAGDSSPADAAGCERKGRRTRRRTRPVRIDREVVRWRDFRRDHQLHAASTSVEVAPARLDSARARAPTAIVAGEGKLSPEQMRAMRGTSTWAASLDPAPVACRAPESVVASHS
jgi:hypothetical protein